MNFKVSIVIPVYNAEEFVRQAVESAVKLDEVAEVIVVEDGSPDNALAVCKQLEMEFDKVRLFQHDGGVNKGAAQSRNLGIEKAGSAFIAFLDADDWYLSHRFKMEAKVFQQYPMADAVYSCSIIEDQQGDNSMRYGARADIRQKIGFDASPKQFSQYLLSHELILFDTNSITIKRDFLVKDKLFDSRLELHQDTELWKRLMRRGNFFAGETVNPVAIVRRHKNNRIQNRSIHSKIKMHSIFLSNVGVENLYSFEKRAYYKIAIRLISMRINQRLFRAMYYYCMLVSNWLRPNAFINQLTAKYGTP
jgi:glycosyltransferase involved in cell wall biosynthesis